MGPLHHTALDPDEAWGASLKIRCACGADFVLWQKRCRGCRAKNPYPRLLKKRKRVERWFDRKVDAELLPGLARADLVPDAVRQYERMLAEVIRRPLPERQRDEEFDRYLKRVVTFFPSMFKTTSPARHAREIDDRLSRSAAAMSGEAFAGVERIVGQATGASVPGAGEQTVGQQAALRRDLAELWTPYLEALKIMQMYHNRMVNAWAPVRPILQRPLPSGKIKGAWDKVRGIVNPVGRLLKFGTAVWQDPEEKEHLKRFEDEILRFHEQVGRFVVQTEQLDQRSEKLRRTWRLSLRKHLVQRLAEHIAAADPGRRESMVKRLLAQKGVGGWLWRLMFGRRHR